ncbi:MAG: dehydratase [Sphingomonadales bacterium]|nr:MAG: dehydratase [Sphingomonadales bacterium]
MAEAVTIDTSPWTVGTRLPETTHGPITRTTLALFAGASNDHVDLHIDSDFAKAAGLEDVIAHGMLTMAYLAQALESWTDHERLRGWNVRFTAMVPVQSVIRCGGEVTEIFQADGEKRARLKICALTTSGTEAVGGEAVVAMD